MTIIFQLLDSIGLKFAEQLCTAISIALENEEREKSLLSSDDIVEIEASVEDDDGLTVAFCSNLADKVAVTDLDELVKAVFLMLTLSERFGDISDPSTSMNPNRTVI